MFHNAELSVDVLLASACLPKVYQAVQIGDDFYWDGGYTGNPALAPLYLGTSATDLIVVGINPMERTTVPQTARGIVDRVDEISFNSTFMLEFGDRNLQDRSRCAGGRGSEPLEIGEPIVKYELIRMPDSTGFGDYTESGQVITVRFRGEDDESAMQGVSPHLPPARANGRATPPCGIPRSRPSCADSGRA